MNIKTFKPEEYRSCPVYYRNFKDHFEYLTIIKKQIYTAHISVKPHWITKFFCFIGTEKMPYTEHQQGAILKVLRRMAETTIDSILDKKT